MRLIRIFPIIALLFLSISISFAEDVRPNRIQVKVHRYDPYIANNYINLVCYRLMQEDPSLDIEPFREMAIQGGPGQEASRYMSHAARMAPDVVTWITFHDIREYVRQGFYLPLDDYVGKDMDGDGFISDSEAIWPEWKNIPEYYRRVATVDGHVYGLPFPDMGMATILYRKDMFRKAGLDPEKPPATFEEFFYMLQRLTDPNRVVPGAKIQRGQMGIVLQPEGWQFCAWVWAAGGDLLMQGKTNPRTNKTYWYPQEELKFADPDTGESLLKQKASWKATFGEAGGQRALEFYRKMRFQKWVRDPQTKEPVNLTDQEAAQGWKLNPDGSKFRFPSKDVIEGVARVLWGSDDANHEEIMRRGEVATMFFICQPDYFQTLDIPAENLGFFPVPGATKEFKPAMLAHYHYMALNSELAGDKNKAKRDKSWQILSTLTGSRGARWLTEMQVKAGLARFIPPSVLERAGYTQYMDGLPDHWRKNWEAALKYARTEPFEGFWPPIKTKILNNDVLSLALTQKNFDWRAALIKAEHDANTGLMFKRPEQEMQRYRPWGWLGVSILGIFMLIMFWKVRQALSKKVNVGDVVTRRGRIAWSPVLLLAPALLLIATWAYYPLLRGGMMAFQNYRITGESTYIGVDNFINVILDSNFWVYLRQTFKFVFFSVGLGFFTPILLALILSEVPRGKMLFRTLFFLPQISSGLVILFLWKMFYNPTPSGFLNKTIMALSAPLLWFDAPFFQKLHDTIAKPIDWLGDPKWTMIAVILPGVWAGAGMGSLIYQAALKSIPEDLYEAAEVDGATMWRKLWHITIPSLLPLLIINFVGAFIGTFSSMGNIFAMTAGGPGNETMVMSLAIWYEAFAYLKFGTATAMAWILGSILVGFTLMQLRILRRVEFRRAEAD